MERKQTILADPGEPQDVTQTPQLAEKEPQTAECGGGGPREPQTTEWRTPGAADPRGGGTGKDAGGEDDMRRRGAGGHRGQEDTGGRRGSGEYGAEVRRERMRTEGEERRI